MNEDNLSQNMVEIVVALKQLQDMFGALIPIRSPYYERFTEQQIAIEALLERLTGD